MNNLEVCDVDSFFIPKNWRRSLQCLEVHEFDTGSFWTTNDEPMSILCKNNIRLDFSPSNSCIYDMESDIRFLSIWKGKSLLSDDVSDRRNGLIRPNLHIVHARQTFSHNLQTKVHGMRNDAKQFQCPHKQNTHTHHVRYGRLEQNREIRQTNRVWLRAQSMNTTLLT